MLHKASPSLASGRLEADGLCVPFPPCRDEPDAIFRLNDNTVHWTLAGGMGGISELKRRDRRVAHNRTSFCSSTLECDSEGSAWFYFLQQFYDHTVSQLVHIKSISTYISFHPSLSLPLFLSTYICIYTSSRFYTPRPSFFTPFHTPDWRWRWIEDEACCRLPRHFASLPFLKAASSPHFSRLSLFLTAFISLSNTAGRLPFSFYLQEPGLVGASDSCLKSQPAQEKCLQAHYSAKKKGGGEVKVSPPLDLNNAVFHWLAFHVIIFRGEKKEKLCKSADIRGGLLEWRFN